MKIYGLQKLTLLDFPGHTACTDFLGGCDWRCPFCHNFATIITGSRANIYKIISRKHRISIMFNNN